jgi:hypothetical protein
MVDISLIRSIYPEGNRMLERLFDSKSQEGTILNIFPCPIETMYRYPSVWSNFRVGYSTKSLPKVVRKMTSISSSCPSTFVKYSICNKLIDETIMIRARINSPFVILTNTIHFVIDNKDY